MLIEIINSRKMNDIFFSDEKPLIEWNEVNISDILNLTRSFENVGCINFEKYLIKEFPEENILKILQFFVFEENKFSKNHTNNKKKIENFINLYPINLWNFCFISSIACLLNNFAIVREIINHTSHKKYSEFIKILLKYSSIEFCNKILLQKGFKNYAYHDYECIYDFIQKDLLEFFKEMIEIPYFKRSKYYNDDLFRYACMNSAYNIINYLLENNTYDRKVIAENILKVKDFDFAIKIFNTYNCNLPTSEINISDIIFYADNSKTISFVEKNYKEFNVDWYITNSIKEEHINSFLFFIRYTTNKDELIKNLIDNFYSKEFKEILIF